MEKKTCYITTPIYYASGEVHIGNSYSTIACDALARYKRLAGYDTVYLTGMDEHGQKIEEAAKKAGVEPQEFVDNIASKTSDLWKELKISNDGFIRTSYDYHVSAVQKMFEKLLAQDDIYLGSYEGNYCVACESFFTKTQLGEGETCPDCGAKTRIVKEESYFLRLKKYEKQLLDYIDAHPDFIMPLTRRNEVISFIKQGLEDLCVSRTSYKWGVQVPSNPKHVIYVWIDALANYITYLGYNNDETNFKKYWLDGDEVIHVVGKDILRFHAIYWPIMLMALGLPIKFKLYAHGWIMMSGGKMSKSKGNVVYPLTVKERYGLDPLRFYLCKEMPTTEDGLFTYERFIEQYNVYLANDLGNLVSRSIAMVNKYFGGSIEKVPNTDLNKDANNELERIISENVAKYHECMQSFQLQNAINAIFEIVGFANKYIDLTTPWALAKDENLKNELNDCLYHLLETLRIVTIMLQPFMVETTITIFDELGVDKDYQVFEKIAYGAKTSYKVIEKAIVLFKRLDLAEEYKKYGISE
ncbi:MAG: methionine--tRNA ligase [Bacilli bacterium]|nr:methionine--tRNA ligase [Bacilli bacterium]